MNANEYQAFVLKGLVQRKTGTQRSMEPSNFLLGLAGEVGEMINAFKHEVLWPDTASADAQAGVAQRATKTLNEAGDVLWYLVAVLSVLGLTLDDTMKMNIEKLEKRYGSDNA